MGKAVLAAMDRNYMRKILHRINAECEAEQRVSFEAATQQCDETSSEGFASASEHGGRMIAMLLSQSAQEEGLVLGMLLGEEQFETQREYYVQLLRGAAARLVTKTRYAPPARNVERAPMHMMA
jgi:DNA-binding IclR family transcriptional regulator